MVQEQLQRGAYLLVIELRRPARIRFGARGLFRLEKGYYAYAGRAARSLPGRLRRYLAIAGGKDHRFTLRWHADHLLAHRHASISRILLADENPDGECAAARRAARLPGASTLPGRIGASDCREGCPGHLVRLGRDLPEFGSSWPVIDEGPGDGTFLLSPP
jgi:Uri superfamily endonuclease